MTYGELDIEERRVRVSQSLQTVDRQGAAVLLKPGEYIVLERPEGVLFMPADWSDTPTVNIPQYTFDAWRADRSVVYLSW
jgi:hypothetical protein